MTSFQRQLTKKRTLVNVKTKRRSVDDLIGAISEKLNHKLNLGINLTNIPFIQTKEMFDILLFIFGKAIRSQNDNLIIRHYLYNFPGLITTLNLKKSFSDPEEIMNKICLFIQCEHKQKDTIICLNGQIGDKFYLIFNGLVAVLVPIEYKMFLRIEDFIIYLENLKKNNEFDLIHRSIMSNRKLISDKYSKIILEYEKICSMTVNLTKFKSETIDWKNYIERLIPKGIKKNSESLEFTLWKYHYVCDLETGKNFGDVALKDDSKRRTATIITLKESYFGTLKKDIYQSCIKDALEKIRRANIDSITSSKLFKNYGHDSFEMNFYNFFKYMTFDKGSYLFKQGEKRKEIFFIKNGELKAEIYGNCEYLNNIIKTLGGDSFNKLLYDLINQNYKMFEFNKELRTFSLFFIKNGDIIGMEDYINKDETYICNVRCSSATVELFSLDLEFFLKLFKEKTIRENYRNWIESRKKVMLKRIKELKENTLLHFYSFVKEKSHDNWRTAKHFQKEKSNNQLLRNTYSSFPRIINIKSELNIKDNENKDNKSNPGLYITDGNLKNNNNFNLDKDKKNRRTRNISEAFTLPSSNYQSERKKNMYKSIFQKSKDYFKMTLTIDNTGKQKPKIKFGNYPVNKRLVPRLKLYNDVIDKLICQQKKLCVKKKNINKILKNFDILSFDKYIEKNKSERKYLHKPNNLKFDSKFYDYMNNEKFMPNSVNNRLKNKIYHKARYLSDEGIMDYNYKMKE